VKYRLREHVLLRAEFLDYLTTFPRQQIVAGCIRTVHAVVRCELQRLNFGAPRQSHFVRRLLGGI
jgi:hypothetical protein